jgi:hypothetical protein
MNKGRVKKKAWGHVRLRPVAKRFYGAEGPIFCMVVSSSKAQLSGPDGES